MISLAEFFPPDHVLRFRAPDQGAAMTELARRAAALLGMPPAPVAAGLAARESLGSTGVGAGIAVPHARLPTLAHLWALFARLDRPVEWRSIDGRPVDLVFMMLSPSNAAGEHLAALAMVTRRLRDPGVAAAIRAAATPAAIRAALVGEAARPAKG
jgi:PTS system nitrogen regulatory IIA component